MAKKPRPRVEGKVPGVRKYPWEWAKWQAKWREKRDARMREPDLQAILAEAATRGRATQAKKWEGHKKRVVFHISLTGDYPERLIAWARERAEGNCSAAVRLALDFYWEHHSDLP